MAGFKKGSIDFNNRSEHLVQGDVYADHLNLYAKDGRLYHIDDQGNTSLVAISGDVDLSGYATISSITSISGDLGTLQTQFNELDLTYATDANLASISGNLQGQIISNDGDISLLQTQTSTISGDLNSLETQFTNLDLTYATDSMVASISGNLQGQIISNDGDISLLQTQTSTISGDLNSLETQFTNLDLTYATDANLVSISGNLQGQITSNNNQLTGLVAISASHDSRLDTLEQPISASNVAYQNGSPLYYYNNGVPTNVDDALDAVARESFFGKHLALQQLSTSINVGGTISISGSTSITVEGGFGYWVDHTTFDASGRNPTYTKVTWATQEIAIPNISGGEEFSFVYVDATDSQVKFKQTEPTPEDYRNKFLLGKVIHRDATADFVVQLQPTGNDVYNQYSDLAHAIGTVNINGNIFSPSDPNNNLTIVKSSGSSFRLNSQTGDVDNPHTTTDPILDTNATGTFSYVYQDGSGGVTYTNGVTEVDPDNYDDGTGTLSSVSNNKFTVQRIYSFPKPSTGGGGKSYIFYGQAEYGTIDDAIAGIETEDFTLPAANFYDASLRGWLIVKDGITDFSDDSSFKFVTAGKFGDSGAGSSVTSSVGSVFRDDLFRVENDGDPSSYLRFDLQNILDTGEVINIKANSAQDGDIDITLPAISGQLALTTEVELLETYTNGITGGIIQLDGRYLNIGEGGFITTSEVNSISGNLQGQITSNDGDISLLQTQTSTISGDLNSLETQFTNLDLTYATDANLVSISGNLQGQITSNDGDISLLQTQTSTISGDLNSLETQFTNLDLTYATDANLVSISGNLQGQITSNDTDITNLRTDVNAISGGLTQLEDLYVNVNGDTMTGTLVISGADLTISNLSTISGANQTLTTDVSGQLVKSGVSNTITVTQATHGFTQLDVIYNNVGTWEKAQADDADTLAIAMVTEVIDTDNFKYISVGQVNITSHGLTVGQYYYTSTTTAGDLVITPPDGLTEFSNPICYVLDADNLLIFPWRASQALNRAKTTTTAISASTYSATRFDEFILANAVSNNIAITLPDPTVLQNKSLQFTVKKIDSSANTVSVVSTSGNMDSVVGTTGKTISVQNNTLTFVSDGSNYWIR